MLTKTKLNSIEALISNALTDSYISRDEFVFVNDVFVDDLYQLIKNFNILIKQCLFYCLKSKETDSKNSRIVKTKSETIMLL